MATRRKDNKGRALFKGESQRKSDGLYVYKYINPVGCESYIYAKDLGKLREKKNDLIVNQLTGLDVYLQGKATIDFVFDRYIKTKTSLRSSTYAGYMYTYNHFVRGGFGKKKIADIHYSQVVLFYQYLLDERKISLGTLDSVHSVLHPTFQLAVRDNILHKNPSDGAMAEIKKTNWGKSANIRHALTVAEQKAFVEALELDNNLKWKPILTVLLGTGCRIGEIIGLRWQDVDFNERVIRIDHSVTYYPRMKDTYRCEFEVSLPKTENGIRTVPMLPEVYDALMLERGIQKATGNTCEVELDGMSGFIFANRFGNLYNPQAINKAIKRICEDYNAKEEIQAKKEKRLPVMLPHFSCHHLRHTFCTRLCETETNIKVIQKIMGHADITTTMNIYADVTEETKQDTFKDLSRTLNIF